MRRKVNLYVYGCIIIDYYKQLRNRHPCTFDAQVTSASYGQFYEPCNSDCCVPGIENDCTNSVEANSPVAWETLISECNHENYCEVPNGGGIMQNCTTIIVDYLLINYNCTPSMSFLKLIYNVIYMHVYRGLK